MANFMLVHHMELGDDDNLHPHPLLVNLDTVSTIQPPASPAEHVVLSFIGDGLSMPIAESLDDLMLKLQSASAFTK